VLDIRSLGFQPEGHVVLADLTSGPNPLFVTKLPTKLEPVEHNPWEVEPVEGNPFDAAN
jgi:hypothetical protein